MMTTLHPTNSYNVETTLNVWFQSALASYVAPPTIPTTALTLNIPESGIKTPAFSLNHMPVTQQHLWQGDVVSTGVAGAKQHALLDISVWTSRNDTPNWQKQLSVMGAVVKQIILKTPVVVINDYATAASPSATNFKINIGNIEASVTPPDPNPAISRQRFLISYNWVEQTTTP